MLHVTNAWNNGAIEVCSGMSFSPAMVSLHGRHLIEASAGTGKNLQHCEFIFAAIAGATSPQPNNQPFVCRSDSGCNFTNAATDELVEEFVKLKQLCNAFRSGNSSDAFIGAICATVWKTILLSYRACERLYSALLLVDDAAIFTNTQLCCAGDSNFLFENRWLADVEVTIGSVAIETLSI